MLLAIPTYAQLSANESDTSFWFNGQPQMIAIGSEKPNVFYQAAYDSAGTILFVGNYEIKDSVLCVGCSTPGRKIDYVYFNNHSYYTDSIRNTIRVGEWAFYDSKGNKELLITYEPKVHTYGYGLCPNPSGPCSGSTMTEFLIKKIKYLNHQGDIYKTEDYVNGLKTFVTEY